MIVFLDTSTILAASWSAKGLSRLLIDLAPKEGWELVTAEYCIAEVERNVGKQPAGGTAWRRTIRQRLAQVGSVYIFDWPIVFDATKDKPVVLSAMRYNSLRIVAHKLRGGALFLGASHAGIASALAELEHTAATGIGTENAMRAVTREWEQLPLNVEPGDLG